MLRICWLTLILLLGAASYPAASGAILGHCGTRCKIEDKRTLTLRDLIGGGHSDSSPGLPQDQDGRAGDHDPNSEAGYSTTIERIERNASNDWSDEDRDGDQSDLLGGFRRRVKCALYRLEYVQRHGARTPRPLRRFHGCEKWSRDHFYWERRRVSGGVLR